MFEDFSITNLPNHQVANVNEKRDLTATGLKRYFFET